MSIVNITRRGFLKGACILSGGLLLGVRMVSKAYASVKEIKGYMADRINSVYKADVEDFPVRCSQDNEQVKLMYQRFAGKPLSHKSEEIFHTKWVDRSAGIKKLMAEGVYPDKRAAEFKNSPYMYEDEYMEYAIRKWKYHKD